MSKTLVTTALESTWPVEGPILFLGSWCCSFSRQDFWSSLDYEIISYHWDDRKKLLKDYSQLEIVYEQFLVVLADRLNEIHGTKFPIRFWRILIGPWLYTSIQVIFDRWYMLTKAIKHEKSMNVFVLDNGVSSLITDDMDAFNNAIETDIWNEALYSYLLKNFFQSEVLIKNVKNNIDLEDRKILFWRGGLKVKLRKLSNILSRILSGDNDVFIIAPHMSFLKQILLHVKLRQFPVLWFRDKEELGYKNDFQLRKKMKLRCETDILPDFASVLNELLLNLIPRAYLEGFEHLLNSSNSQGWPKKPNTIFTSNSYASDEQFKCWVGGKVINGSKLIIGQHGGNFGMSFLSSHEAHQMKIADKWFSWGWSSDFTPKVVPVGNFKSKFTRIKHRDSGDALMTTMTLPKYSYYLYSVPIAGQLADYLDDQLKFAKALPDYILNNLRVRLYTLDRGWDQKARWQTLNNKISFDNNKRSLVDSLRSSRVFIGTYNATTYLEAFSVNMPSILFWNPLHWEVNAETATYFERLKRVKVLHDTPTSAATHLVKIWNNVDDWWFDNEVQDIIDDFNSRYSMQNPRLLNEMSMHLKAN